MSATIYYRAVSASRNTLNVWGPSAFVDSMRVAFGDMPVKLGQDSIMKLEGMAAVFQAGKHETNPYLELLDKIEKIGTIEIWAEY